MWEVKGSCQTYPSIFRIHPLCTLDSMFIDYGVAIEEEKMKGSDSESKEWARNPQWLNLLGWGILAGYRVYVQS